MPFQFISLQCVVAFDLMAREPFNQQQTGWKELNFTGRQTLGNQMLSISALTITKSEG